MIDLVTDLLLVLFGLLMFFLGRLAESWPRRSFVVIFITLLLIAVAVDVFNQYYWC